MPLSIQQDVFDKVVGVHENEVLSYIFKEPALRQKGFIFNSQPVGLLGPQQSFRARRSAADNHRLFVLDWPQIFAVSNNNLSIIRTVCKHEFEKLVAKVSQFFVLMA